MRSFMRPSTTFAILVSSAVLLTACSSVKLDEKPPVEERAVPAASSSKDQRTVEPVTTGSTDPLVKQEERTRAARQSGSGPVSKEKARSELGLTRQQAAPATPKVVAPAPTVMQDAAPAAAAAAPEPTAATPATSRAANMIDNLGAAMGRLPNADQRRRMIELVDALPPAGN